MIDEQLPPGLADHLQLAGHFAEHVRNVGLGGATDSEVRAYAKKVSAVLITKDEDFASVDLAADVPVVWIRLGNVTNRALWAALGPVIGELVSAVEAGEMLVEIS